MQALKDAATTRQLQVGILIFDKAEVLDFCGPFEALSVCRLDPTADDNVTESPFVVKLIAQNKQPITTIGGMQVLPHHSIADCCGLDILIIPGGFGSRQVRNNPQMIEFVRQRARTVKILASVCTGALVLAESAVLEKESKITTHWQALDLLQEWYPDLHVERGVSVVKLDENEKRPTVYTSAGISAGIDMSFWMIKDIFGESIARATAKQMEYSYPENFSRRIDL